MKRRAAIGDKVTYWQMMIGGELATRAPKRTGTIVGIMGSGQWTANLTPSKHESYIVELATGTRELISVRQVATIEA